MTGVRAVFGHPAEVGQFPTTATLGNPAASVSDDLCQSPTMRQLDDRFGYLAAWWVVDQAVRSPKAMVVGRWQSRRRSTPRSTGR
jgi:hypothetical protein